MGNKIKENVQAILLIAAFLGVCSGAVTYFATASEFQELKFSYQFDKLTQRHNAVQE